MEERNGVGDAGSSGSVQPGEGKVKQDVEGRHGSLEPQDGQGESGNEVVFVSTKGQGSRPWPSLG